MNYGYVRVSTQDQNTERQIIAMKAIGINDESIYIDKQSGNNYERPQYQQLIHKLHNGDCLYIMSIDRLGRNYEDIKNQWTYIVKSRHADIVFLDMPILDTRVGKDLIGTFLSDIVLQILSFVAENERNNIKKRQAEGITAAKIRGVKFGRPRKPLPQRFALYAEKYLSGELSGIKSARDLDIPPSRFYRCIKHYYGNRDLDSV